MRITDYLSLAVGMALLTPAQAADLGRLYYTSEQRQQLERGNSAVAAAPTLNGIVQHGKQRTLWLDGQAQVHSGRGSSTSQSLTLPGKPAVRVKVGERAP